MWRLLCTRVVCCLGCDYNTQHHNPCALKSQGWCVALYRAGLRLGKDGKKCVDIDECAEGTAPCDQECENKDPRETGLQYVCKCRSGFSVDIENQHKCISKVRQDVLHSGCDVALKYTHRHVHAWGLLIFGSCHLKRHDGTAMEVV